MSRDCTSINGAIHLKLNDIIVKLVQYYKITDEITDAKPEWILQETLILINRILQSYFYHRVELDLAHHKS
jgi:hypothetical protein